MPLSEGQRRALDQLNRIASTLNSALHIDHVEEPDSEGQALQVDVSIDCRSYVTANGGLRFNPREAFQLHIRSNFPYQYPDVWVAHKRFDGFPHVQWKRHLCLYQAPDTEWRPEAGMYDFMRRIHAWFRDAAQNKLDPAGGPLHPPAVYPESSKYICANVDAPVFQDDIWIGGALFNRITNKSFGLDEWLSFNDAIQNEHAAPAFLLSKPFNFEYPTNVRDLVRQLESAGVVTTRLIVLLAMIARLRSDEIPLYVVIGTPMRGIAGEEGERKQHLAVWEIEPIAVKKLSMLNKALNLSGKLVDANDQEQLGIITADIINDFYKWMDQTKITWCRVLENRPEITIRRDINTPLHNFAIKKVAVLGCGALGGQIAEHLVRAGCTELTLVDNDIVDPGILVRQNFEYGDIASPKVDALKQRLQRINKSIVIKSGKTNLYSTTSNLNQWFQNFDVVIDTTASLRVRTRIEEEWRGNNRAPIITCMMISGRAEYGALAIAGPVYSGATIDVFRRLGLAAMNRNHLSIYRDAFWSNEPDKNLFQPEPGCSDPTFVGSSADIATLAARMLNRLGEYIENDQLKMGEGHLVTSKSVKHKEYCFSFHPDITVTTGNGVDVRITRSAWRDISGWIRQGQRLREPRDETGGLLFGQFNEATKTLWVTEVIGPTSDSQFSEEEFICGIKGASDINEEKKTRTRGAVQFIGSWHSHPVSPAIPSQKDWMAIGEIYASNLTQAPQQLMMIIGHASESPEIGAYIFERSTFKHINEQPHFLINADGGVTQAPTVEKYGKRMGLALSGGGSRAVAYHLGCLRALNDLNLLDDVEVISGVSGGSVMSALFGYNNNSFEEVEKKTLEFLRKGALRHGFIKLFKNFRIVPIIISFLVSTLPAILLWVVRIILSRIVTLAGGNKTVLKWIDSIQWPIPRFYSRTHVIAEVMRDILGDKPLNAPTRNNKAVVFNACELATGTAFRMSNTAFGSWRFGKVDPGKLTVAQAVTASAAYPIALPAFDLTFRFEDIRTGKSRLKRVIVTDGGVFENLAVSCMEPGRSSEYSINTYDPEIIVSCDAGAGQFKGDKTAGIWPLRMAQSFEAIFRKVQDATKGRLHRYAEEGQLAAFVYSHLGQIDSKIPVRPSIWVSREDVMDYPTNFSAMKDDDIEKLSARGEYITRTLICRYLLSE